ncbi:hypothetical protein K435DRAFT_810778 [Dendrothele bispora CBS 962.96]|uniref:Uncharacterized protein n=1 Tax=Dendrothele bispora (strain CBS 962.96) TaxID=1314807 RepID=A0A4S8KU31_DENBC|nr:hypothetical protein K435DRAFT_810778 [Dendrothele bispora CBS 962.96]
MHIEDYRRGNVTTLNGLIILFVHCDNLNVALDWRNYISDKRQVEVLEALENHVVKALVGSVDEGVKVAGGAAPAGPTVVIEMIGNVKPGFIKPDSIVDIGSNEMSIWEDNMGRRGLMEWIEVLMVTSDGYFTGSKLDYFTSR